eukprot:382602_1
MSSSKNIYALKWDKQYTQLLKSTFPSDLRHLIITFIFTNNCIHCNEYVDLYSYFCKQCSLKRLVTISKGDYHYEVDTFGILGISVENEDIAECDEYEEGYVTYRIYHLLSGTLIYTSSKSHYLGEYALIYTSSKSHYLGEYVSEYYGSFTFKFCDQILKPYVVSYSIYNGDEKNGVKKELNLSTMKIFKWLNWHFEGNIDSTEYQETQTEQSIVETTIGIHQITNILKEFVSFVSDFAFNIVYQDQISHQL